ncbi:MAG: P-loop NTPase, partial [Methyloceanibacter sp.]
AKSEAKRLGVPFLGEVPLTLAIRETSDEGRPVVATDPTSPAAQAYREIAARAFAELERKEGGARPAPQIVMEN